MNEIIWKTLVYQNQSFDKFEISNEGKIRNAITKKVYKTCTNKQTGYVQVCVSMGSRNKKKLFKLHRAVAETFIPNPDNKREINHKDGNKENNCMSNLEWTTPSENIQHAVDTGLLPSSVNSPLSKLTAEDVIYIRNNCILGDKIYGAKALGERFNVSSKTIRNVIHGKSYINV